MSSQFINIHLAVVYDQPVKKDASIITTLAWGDVIEVVKVAKDHVQIELSSFNRETGQPMMIEGYIIPSKSGPKPKDITAPLKENKVIKVDFVDVQQGDGAIVETPDGKIMLIDGGDNQLFARYLAARFGGSSASKPRKIDYIVVTHGDADHFNGLIEIFNTEEDENLSARKKLFINPQRVYHNGLVKRGITKPDKTKRKDTELFGKTVKDGNNLYVTALEDDLTKVSDDAMNKYFLLWKKALLAYKKRNKSLVIKRLDNKTKNAFQLDNISVELLGPLTEEVDGKPALKFLVQPPKQEGTAQRGPKVSRSYSASHTVNGHSIVMRLVYGNVRFLFSGDLNEEAEQDLVVASKTKPILEAEVFKVPHHGSADFANSFISAVKPIVSVVSSGDESEAKEYIHPRATLVGALGKHSRIERPLIFITELVAFFQKESYVKQTGKNGTEEFFAFSRKAFGIVKVRTDGKILFVYTNSGKEDTKEAYAYDLSDQKNPVRVGVLVSG